MERVERYIFCRWRENPFECFPARRFGRPVTTFCIPRPSVPRARTINYIRGETRWITIYDAPPRVGRDGLRSRDRNLNSSRTGKRNCFFILLFFFSSNPKIRGKRRVLASFYLRNDSSLDSPSIIDDRSVY